MARSEALRYGVVDPAPAVVPAVGFVGGLAPVVAVAGGTTVPGSPVVPAEGREPAEVVGQTLVSGSGLLIEARVRSAAKARLPPRMARRVTAVAAGAALRVSRPRLSASM